MLACHILNHFSRAYQLFDTDWKEMLNQGKAVQRLVAIQGDLDAHGNEPVYRHPVDVQPAMTPFSPLAAEMRDVLAQRLQQPFNHALIQCVVSFFGGQENLHSTGSAACFMLITTFGWQVLQGWQRPHWRPQRQDTRHYARKQRGQSQPRRHVQNK